MSCAPMRLSRAIQSATALFAFAIGAAPALAGPAYLKIGGVEGEHAGTGRGGHIDVESWSWGETRATDGGTTLKGQKIGENAPGGDTDQPVVTGRISSSSGAGKESGEKGGTTDINIGVGELQEATISKSADAASPAAMGWDNTVQKPWKTRAAPASRGAVRVKVKFPWLSCRVGARYPMVELGDGSRTHLLHGVTVASCGGDGGTSARPTEEVTFVYTRID